MKLTRLVAAASLAALLSGAGSALAAVEGHTGEIQIYAGWNWPDTSNDDIDDLTAGLRVGYNVNKRFGIEGNFGYFDTEASLPAPINDLDITAWFVDVSLVFQANPDGRAVFLAYAGPGWTDWSADTKLAGVDGDESSFSGHVGLAGKFYATDRVFIRVDGKVRFFDIDNDIQDDSVTDYEGTVSIGWTIGN